MHYIKNKRNKIDVCNICGSIKPLSWDHVPPKGGIQLSMVQMRSVFEVLTGNSKEFMPTESQNGVKYRTICKSCNEIMGRKYDPIINEFALSVGEHLKSNLILPSTIYQTTKPAALIRGILGHLIAAKVERDEVVFDQLLAPLVLNENIVIPEKIHIFYWIYPYNYSCTIRDIGIATLNRGEIILDYCQLLKYFPIAYVVTENPYFYGLDELTRYREYPINEELSIPIRLDRIEPIYWPEKGENDKIIFGGANLSNSIYASRKR